ncbi:MAG: hypothetical protein IKN55_00070 [Oscillospiraceae bacterium]|nr:hypothetical protein [Oscillospiraceae bacterium]
MYLSSFTFTVAVLPVLLLCYYLIPVRAKRYFLLIAGLLLYGWGSPVRVLYLAACVLYDYGTGLLLEKWKEKRVLSMIVLAFSAVMQTGAMVWIRGSVTGDLLFPFGIAIYTLQGLGYLIGIYRRRHTAEVNFPVLALYLTLFPVLYAGPLLSFLEYKEQLGQRPCSTEDLSEGLSLFLRGLAQKVVLADTFGYIFRELRQTDSEQMSMLTAWLTTIVFSLYLYFELLGYSEMARGLGRTFGFTLPRNFSQPFFTSSITTYMQSWNITLVLWFQTNFRYFLFGEHQSKWRKYSGLILMWTLIGCWYGMKPQFALWGLTIGLLLTAEQLLLGPALKKRYVVGLFYTAIVLQFAWVLFFADSLSDAGTIWASMLGFGAGIADRSGTYFFTSYIAVILIGLYIATDLFRNISERIAETKFGRSIAIFRPAVNVLLLLLSLASMLYGERIQSLWLRL